MTARELLSLLSRVRQCGDSRWMAACPSHEDRSPSLSVREIADRILLRCHAGCTVADICGTLDITVADLYSDRYRPPDLQTLRRRRAAENLAAWRDAEIKRISQDLRERDVIIREISLATRGGLITEDEAFLSLEYEYRGYSDLTSRLEKLIRNVETLELWRESSRCT